MNLFFFYFKVCYLFYYYYFVIRVMTLNRDLFPVK